MTAFLSTYVNKVDRKGRVSVPAAFRSVLANSRFQGIIAYPSLTEPSIEAFGRDMLEEMTHQRFQRNLDGGDFERVLLGGGGDGVIDVIMSLVTELPFDGEGRIILPGTLAQHASIDDAATFVGRGDRFQIWHPDTFDQQQSQALEHLRARMRREGT